ncbi:MAG: hypothetical protein HETSPECPRED_008287 [Heterodermia speciosa]|uniref:Uncharacterized protein n=1 Tax=Heterodermia speciosa TaxID=116794 RepID=A0A8H3FWU0_9LECA|nr:MAG: hypothetical protein HETSPECPRED_008287 [Heterodermia speciosa]
MFPSALGKKISSKPAEQGDSVNNSLNQFYEADIARLNAAALMPQRQHRPMYCWPRAGNEEKIQSNTAPQTQPLRKPIFQQASFATAHGAPTPQSLPRPIIPHPTISYPTVLPNQVPPNIETSFSTPRPAPVPPHNHAPFNLHQNTFLAPKVYAVPPPTAQHPVQQTHTTIKPTRTPTKKEAFKSHLQEMQQEKVRYDLSLSKYGRIWSWLDAIPVQVEQEVNLGLLGGVGGCSEEK